MNGLHTIKPAVPDHLLNAAIVLHHDHPGLIVRVNLPTGEVQYRWHAHEHWTTYHAVNPGGIAYIAAHRIPGHREAVLQETMA